MHDELSQIAIDPIRRNAHTRKLRRDGFIQITVGGFALVSYIIGTQFMGALTMEKVASGILVAGSGFMLLVGGTIRFLEARFLNLIGSLLDLNISK